MNSRGYTLLEVSLFLAISGALTLVAIVGLGPRLNNVRFSTGMRDIQNNITKELSASQLGKSRNSKPYKCSSSVFEPGPDDSTVTGGENSTCVIVGRIAHIKSTNISYRTIVATTQVIPSSACTASTPGTFNYVKVCNKPKILEDSFEKATVYNYPNGITNISPGGNIAYGYVKSPTDNTIFRFRSVDWNDAGMYLNAAWANYSPDVDSFPFCFKSRSRTAKLTLFKNTSTPKLEFNEVCS